MKHTKSVKFVILSCLAVLAAFAFAGCGPSGPPSIGEVVTAKSLDASYKPVDPTTTYKPNDQFQVSVEVKNLIVGSTVLVKYSVDGEPYEQTTLTADQEGSGYYGFSLKAGESGHQPGSYQAEVYIDGTLAKTVEFTVEQAGPPAISKIVIAKGLVSNNRPTDPTDSYAPTDKMFISALGENMVKGAKVDLKIIYEGQDISDSFDVTHAGTQYFTLTVDPSADGHPLGDYTVETYLDGALALTGGFSVK